MRPSEPTGEHPISPRLARWRRVGVAATILGGSALIAALALNEVRFNTPSFDGAVNLQVPLSLATTGKYATTNDAVGAFTLQTGPPLLLPIAVAFRFLGVANWTAQLPNVIYLVGSCALLMLFASRFGGILAAVMVLLLLLATQNLFDLGLRGYGEIPALFYFLAALLLFDSWETRSPGERQAALLALLIGACLGLAVLTKTVMLIAFAAVGLTLAVAPIARLRQPRAREVVAFTAGALAVLGAFEAFKLAQLGPGAYVAWWRMMLPAIGQQAGVTDQGSSAGSFLASFVVRFSQLALALNVPRIWLGLWLVAPSLLVLLLAATGRLRAEDWRRRGSLLLLTAMSGGYLVWWLAFTPLTRIWLRRIINGILLHELLSVIALTSAVMLMRGRVQGSRAVRAVAGAVALPLLLGVGAFVRYNLGKLELWHGPSDERVAAERLGKRIRELPKNAVVYGRGWWQAPVVSFFARRGFKDLDWMPRDLLEVDLDHHYFVADQVFSRLAADDLRSVLDRIDYEVVDSVFDHLLLRVKRVNPYPPFAAGEERSDLRRLVNVAEGDYPHVRGFHEAAGGSRWARRFAGVLLSRGGEECLKLHLFFPDMNEYRGGRVHLAVEVDDRLVREVDISSGGPWEAVLPVPKSGTGQRSFSEVEVAIDNWWRPSVGNFAQLGFLMSEVGFVDCGR